MLSFETLVNPAQQDESGAAANLAARGNRRRLRVFVVTFLLVLATGLVFTYSRPAEYRSQARIAVKSAVAVSALPSATAQRSATVTTAASSDDASSMQTAANLLLRRPLIETALATLHKQGVELPEFGTNPAQTIQSALAAEPIAGTNLINLTVTGPQAGHLPAILDALIEAYSRQAVESYATSASAETQTLRQELRNLDQRLAERNKALEDFRESADIVSGERDENQVLARVKGLSISLNLANEKVAQAEGRARSLRESLISGKTAVRSRDNPTLVALETRASQLRESLREQERIYTPQYMAMDPNVRGMRSRLADLEGQIAEQKSSAGQVALAEADDELAAAKQAQQRLQKQIAEERSAVHAFSKNFSAYKSMQEDLAQLEASRRSVSERLLRTETSEASRMPAIQVVEPAITPRDPWRPEYSRDAGISFALAVVVALLVMAVVELFNRPPPASTAPVIVPQPWISLEREPHVALGGNLVPPSLPNQVGSPALLPGAMAFLRELSQPESAQLLLVMNEKDRVWAGLLLCGATVAEVREISRQHLIEDGPFIQISGQHARRLRIPEALFRQLEAASNSVHDEGAELVKMPNSEEQLRRQLICAAHDAGLDDPATVTPDALRHTCIAYLVRQGLRFSDLDRIVGALPADVLAGYASLSLAGIRRTIAEIDTLMPALEALEAG